MEYRVTITSDAEQDLEGFIQYLLFVKKSEQAATNVLNDFEETKKSLSISAGSLELCTNKNLKKQGYRRINFRNHRYFMLYRIVGDMVVVDNIFHELQDYENHMK